MKKLYFLFLLVFLSIGSTNAQNYFPEGAIWYYNSTIYNFPVTYTYTTLKSKGDTIFNGDTLTYLEGYVGCGAGWNELLKQVGQKIYKLNKCDSTFSLLYNFGVNVGDTITTYPDICFAPDSIEIKIDSIIPINVNGNTLNKFYFTQLYPFTQFVASYYGSGSFIEGIGNTDSFYPYIGACDPWEGPLRCYNDTIIGEYKSGLFIGSCDTIYVGINESTKNNIINISPNPTKDKIRITSTSKIEDIQLFDIRGVQLFSTKETEFNLALFPKGIYLLRIHLKEGIINRKIVRE